MPEPFRPTRQQLADQARQHMQSLRAAGVEWLPAPPVPQDLETAGPAVQAPPMDQGDPDQGGPGPTSHEGLLWNKAAQEPASADLEKNRLELKVLAEAVSKCTRCSELVATRTQTVFGVGRAGVELCFVGEAPGADEDAQGEPFVGAAGQLLNRIIAACRMKREEVYICNIIKCRPPGNRTPLANEAANCREFLEKQLDLVQPKFICALGSVAAQNLLGTKESIGKLRGRFHDYRGIPVLCTYHPAFLLPHRSPGKKKDVWEDMKLLMARMGRPVA